MSGLSGVFAKRRGSGLDPEDHQRVR